MAAVKQLEVVDADGAGAVDDRSGQWRGNILRMVPSAISVVRSQAAIFDHMSIGLTVNERVKDVQQGKNAGSNRLRARGIGRNTGCSLYFAYDDEFSSAGETSQFNLINNADLNDSKSIEPGIGSAQFRGTVVERESWPYLAP